MKSRAALALAVCGLSLAATTGADFDSARYLNHIKYLASSEMKGRATGSPELDRAARYIADQFRADGLQPPPGARNYLQPFEVTTSAKLLRSTRLDVVQDGESESLLINKDFTPLSFSSSGKASGGVVFAGYGITAPEYNYDDYAGIDARGKFVVVLAHEPQEYDAASVFEGKVYTEHAQYSSKAANAKAHGARGVLLVADRIHHQPDAEELEPFGTTSGPSDSGVAFLQVKEAVVEPWFRAAGKDIESLEMAMDRDLKPRSFPLAGVEVREKIEVERTVRTVDNVTAWLPGQTEEYVIVGAHYDHLGLGGRYSMAPLLVGTVHPGADDNASGTAGVLELAHYFASRYATQAKPKRGMLFMTFAGEELGLLGSGFYANHPQLPLTKAVTMINLDMIGRVRDGKLFVGGVRPGTTLRTDLDRIATRCNLKIDYSDANYGSSDHTAFTAKGVPVLFFFSGLHGDYHRPSDTWDKIDAPAAVEVLRLVADVADLIPGRDIRD